MTTTFMSANAPSRSAHHDAPEHRLRQKAAEFEGILLAQILQKLSDSYRLPGGEETDGTASNFQELATSALGGGLAQSGGLGIAEMMTRSLSG